MKNVVISGADRNIGLEIAKQFLSRGWRVFAGRFLMELPLLDELKKDYPDALEIVPMDVSKEESVQAAAEQVAKMAGTVDMLIHNAAGFGGQAGEKTQRVDYSTFAVPYNINALGAMRLVHSFAPLMKDSGINRGGGGLRGPPHRGFQLLYVQNSPKHGPAPDVQPAAAYGLYLPPVPPGLGALGAD